MEAVEQPPITTTCNRGTFFSSPEDSSAGFGTTHGCVANITALPFPAAVLNSRLAETCYRLLALDITIPPFLVYLVLHTATSSTLTHAAVKRGEGDFALGNNDVV